MMVRQLLAHSACTLVCILLAVSGTLEAAPVAPEELTIPQPDGSRFHGRPFGDEWNSGYEADSGHTVLHDETTDFWHYAELTPAGKLKKSSLRPGKDVPAGLQKHLRDKSATPAFAAAASDSPTDPTATPAAVLQSEQLAGAAGSHNTVVLLVSFVNRSAVGSTAAQWAANFFGPTASVAHFYKEVSFNQLTVSPAAESHGTANDGIVGWLLLDYNHPDTRSGTGVANLNLTKNAILAADPYINFAAYDSNADGKLSPNELHIVVVVAGYDTSYGGATYSCTPNVWAHRWILGINGVSTPVCDGVTVGGGGYTQFGEWHCSSTDNPGHLATIGVMCHEFGHDLSWPDLYDTDGSSNGVGKWCLMGNGSWNKATGFAGTSPSHPMAWLRWLQGWVTPYSVMGAQSGVSIANIESNPRVIQLLENPNGVDWAFNKNSGTGEFFLVENRQKTGYDAGLPSSGLLTWHIDESRTYSNAANADDTRRLVDLEEADGLAQIDAKTSTGDSGDPFPGSSAKLTFNAGTNPNTNLYSGTASQVVMSDVSACGLTMTASFATSGGSVPQEIRLSTNSIDVDCNSAGVSATGGEPVTALGLTALKATASSVDGEIVPALGEVAVDPAACSITLNEPVDATTVVFPYTFTWSQSGTCSGLSIAFATSPTPSAVYRMAVTTNNYAMTQGTWDVIKSALGPASAYYWSVGEWIGNVFYPRAAYSSFLDGSTCSATLVSPSLGGSVSFPQTFSWNTGGTCASMYLAVANSASPSQVYLFAATGTSAQMSQEQWSAAREALGGAAATYYWSVGNLVDGTFDPRSTMSPFTDAAGSAINSFFIYNDGTSPLNVSSIQLDTATPWLSWYPAAPFTVDGGQSVMVTVTANCNAAPTGTTNRRLLIYSNDTDESPYPGGVNVNISAGAERYALTSVSAPLGGGNISVSPAPGADGKYTAGTVVTLTATPATGFSFTNWSGRISGATNPDSVVVSQDSTVSANFAVQAADLVVQDFRVSATGSNLIYSLTVKNVGTQPAGTFWIDMHYHDTVGPKQTDMGNAYLSVASLAVGASKTVTFTRNSTPAGAYTSWAYIDSSVNQVAELDENNNVAGPLLVVAPGVTPAVTDTFTTMPSWVPSGHTEAVSYDFDTVNQAIRMGVSSVAKDALGNAVRCRIAGWYANDSSDWLPYSAVGADKIVRVKYHVYATGQANPAQKNQIPAFSLRAASRFAVTANLEITPHLNAMPGDESKLLEIAPSTDPAKPSVYRVDFDPIDVPFLQQNAATEGIARSVSVYSLDPQDNGYIAVSESSIGTYPASALPDDEASLRRRMTAAGGDLNVFLPGERAVYNLQFPAGAPEGSFPNAFLTGTDLPTHAVTADGAVFESSKVPADRIGVIERYFNVNKGGAIPNAELPRISEGKQYKIRFHVTGTQQSNRQCPFWLYSRSLGYGWAQKIEFGGAYIINTPSDPNNQIAWQAQPGVGSSVTDGWYSVIMTSPMDVAIRPEFAEGTPLKDRMPQISAQAGPGSSASSWIRDIGVGAFLIDTFNGCNPNANLYEAGNFKIDQIEIREYTVVPD